MLHDLPKRYHIVTRKALKSRHQIIYLNGPNPKFVLNKITTLLIHFDYINVKA